MLSEAYIEKKCCDIAKKAGYKAKKVCFIADNGAPDRLFFKKGHLFFVEFKKENGVLSELQILTIKELTDAGIEVHMINNIEKFKELLK